MCDQDAACRCSSTLHTWFYNILYSIVFLEMINRADTICCLVDIAVDVWLSNCEYCRCSYWIWRQATSTAENVANWLINHRDQQTTEMQNFSWNTSYRWHRLTGGEKKHAEHDISSLNGLIIFLIWLDKEVCNHLSNQNNGESTFAWSSE